MDRLDLIIEKLEKIEHVLTGNGDPSTGLIVRVDRLEQVQERRVEFGRTIMGVALTGLGTAVAALLGVVWRAAKGMP